jgi:NAD+ kinase
MKIAIFGRNFNPDFSKYIIEFFKLLQANHIQFSIYKPFYEFICKETNYRPVYISLFEKPGEAPADINVLISIGGDGTFLDSILFLKNFEIPVIGLNSGRLGFLANISRDEISEALRVIIDGHYEIEKRSLLTIESPMQAFGKYNFALNDATVQKKDTNMITIDTYLNDEFLNTYWTDGLIVSTPTGSTAYSLSVGGPIVIPGAGNFVIAPIASHNLTVRPLVIPDNMELKLAVKSRSGKFLISLDSRTEAMECDQNVFTIRKASFQIRMVKLPFNNFYGTMRNKLMWGADIRN